MLILDLTDRLWKNVAILLPKGLMTTPIYVVCSNFSPYDALYFRQSRLKIVFSSAITHVAARVPNFPLEYPVSANPCVLNFFPDECTGFPKLLYRIMDFERSQYDMGLCVSSVVCKVVERCRCYMSRSRDARSAT